MQYEHMWCCAKAIFNTGALTKIRLLTPHLAHNKMKGLLTDEPLDQMLIWSLNIPLVIPLVVIVVLVGVSIHLFNRSV